jgi:hypoxanthine phosphoribosyltransferase
MPHASPTQPYPTWVSEHLPAQHTLHVLIDEATLNQRLDALAEAINATYAQCDKLVIIGVLTGAFMFVSDLVKRLNCPTQVEFIRLASYDGTHSTGQVKGVDLSLPSLEGQHVLVVEDIMDTGLTLSFLTDYLRALHHTASLRVAVLLDKPSARQPSVEAALKPDFIGFAIGPEFVVGYGLDYNGLFRNLPYIGSLSPTAEPTKVGEPRVVQPPLPRA